VAVGTIAAVAVGAGTLYVWGWRRFRLLRAHWRYRQQRDAFVHQMRRIRDELPRYCYRSASEHDRELLALRGELDHEASQLSGCEFVELGDVVTALGDEPMALMRTFVDPSGTALAIVYIGRERAKGSWLRLDSYTDTERFTTWFRGVSQLAIPSYAQEQTLAPGSPIGELVRRHRTFARMDEPDRGCTRIASKNDVLAVQTKFLAKMLAWRAAQPPEELVDADLRAALGNDYSRLGKQFAHRLRDKLPPAVARRVPRPPD
jgi:hypothetical protein